MLENNDSSFILSHFSFFLQYSLFVALMNETWKKCMLFQILYEMGKNCILCDFVVPKNLIWNSRKHSFQLEWNSSMAKEIFWIRILFKMIHLWCAKSFKFFHKFFHVVRLCKVCIYPFFQVIIEDVYENVSGRILTIEQVLMICCGKYYLLKLYIIRSIKTTVMFCIFSMNSKWYIQWMN